MALRTSQQVRREVDDQVRSQQAVLVLEYACLDPKESPFMFKHHQERGSIPACGIKEFRDVYHVDPKNAYDKVKGKGEPKRTVKGASAGEIVSHVLSVGKDRGVFLRTGDPAEDAKRRAAALKLSRRHRIQADEKIVGRYRDDEQQFRENPRNSGRFCRDMDRPEREAQARLERFREEDLALPVEAKEFRCGGVGCGYWAGTKEELDRHLRLSRHPAARPTTAPAAPAVHVPPMPSQAGPVAVTPVPSPASSGAAIEVATGDASGGQHEREMTAEEKAKVDEYEKKQAERRASRQRGKMARVAQEVEAEGPDPDAPPDFVSSAPSQNPPETGV